MVAVFWMFLSPDLLAAPIPQELSRTLDLWQKLLDRHVSAEGSIDYASMEDEMEFIDAVLTSLGSIDTSRATDAQKTAIYLNVYNAAVIKAMLLAADRLQISVNSSEFKNIKPRDLREIVGGWFYDSIPVMVSGVIIELRYLESALLNKDDIPSRFNAYRILKPDPRIIGSLSCAASSCSQLASQVFREAQIDHQLDASMKRWLARQPDGTVNSMILWNYATLQKNLAPQKISVGTWLASFDQPVPDSVAQELEDQSIWSLRLFSPVKFTFEPRVINTTRVAH